MAIRLINRFILLLDVETTNDTIDAIVYDIGGIICGFNVKQENKTINEADCHRGILPFFNLCIQYTIYLNGSQVKFALKV